jgi:hypothetical protein
MPTLFHEMWWLQAASGGTIDNVSVTRDGVCVASLFFIRRNTFGVRQLRMPPYTRMLGPTFALPASKASSRLVTIRRMTEELIDQLPTHDRLCMTLAPTSEAAFAFSVSGYTLEPDYTFQVSRDVSSADLWTEMDQKTRNAIRAADRKWTVSRHYDLERFNRLSLTNHPGNLNDFDVLGRLFAECVSRGRAVILAAADDDGHDAASAILVWGEGTAYYWLSARHPTLATGGTNSLLIWHAMQFAKENDLIFDFDGFGNRSRGLFLEKFGLRPVARMIVRSANVKGHVLEGLAGALDGIVHTGSTSHHWPARYAAKAASAVFAIGRNAWA